MKKLCTGAGQLSMAAARCLGYGRKIVMGDKKHGNAKEFSETMNNAGFDVEPVEMDIFFKKDQYFHDIKS